jgi:hypothetical protein
MKLKLFYQSSCTSFEEFECSINDWLNNHQNIEIVSTNRTGNSYTILYKELNIGSDSDEVD